MSKNTNDIPFNPVWHMMLYRCTHMASVGVEGLTDMFTADKQTWWVVSIRTGLCKLIPASRSTPSKQHYILPHSLQHRLIHCDSAFILPQALSYYHVQLTCAMDCDSCEVYKQNKSFSVQKLKTVTSKFRNISIIMNTILALQHWSEAGVYVINV